MWTQFYLAVSPPVGCYCHHTAQKLVLVFTVRCYASAVLAMACVCLSITSQSSTKTAKRRITQTTPHDSPGISSFLMPKISAKFDQDHPLRGRQIQVGWFKIVDFPQIAGYVSKMVQDRRMVSIKVEMEVVCALSNGGAAHDLSAP